MSKFLKENKREIFAFFVIVAIGVFFWTQSRYPQLNEKADMGSRIYLSEALSFDVLVPIQASDSIIKKILLTTLNWSNTNKNGMAFGILLGAAVLTFFRLIQNRLISSNNHFLNAFIGMIIGAPLGGWEEHCALSELRQLT